MSTADTKKTLSGISRIKWAYVVMSLFLMALGIFTFIWPEITAGAICSAIGAASIVFGIIKILTYFMREIKGVALNYDFSVGALAVIAGLILLISRDKLVDLLQIVIGIYLVVDSVFKLQTALDAKRLGVGGWWLSLIVTVACLALGIVLIFKIGGDLLMVLIGAALIADGLQNLFLVIFSAVADRSLDRMKKSDASAGAGTSPEPKSTAPEEGSAPDAKNAPTTEAAPKPEPQFKTPEAETISDEEGSNEQ
ncbi:MAG: hypothetical protein EOM54_06145 [Clostridia bacterium]|nr:hypothetical protein [Clostridia bacterium]